MNNFTITEFPIFHRGKVRDVYDLGDALLIISTDRLSAFDCILPQILPNRGKVLTSLSLFWFDKLSYVCPNHILENHSQQDFLLGKYPNLKGRSMFVKKSPKS